MTASNITSAPLHSVAQSAAPIAQTLRVFRADVDEYVDILIYNDGSASASIFTVIDGARFPLEHRRFGWPSPQQPFAAAMNYARNFLTITAAR